MFIDHTTCRGRNARHAIVVAATALLLGACADETTLAAPMTDDGSGLVRLTYDGFSRAGAFSPVWT